MYDLAVTLAAEDGEAAHRPAFDVSICAILRNEAPYLLEWVAFHRAVGIEHFFLYDNESDDGTTELLRALEAAGIVTRIAWPTAHSERIDPEVGAQITAYRDFSRFAHRTRWVAVIDGDEFIVPLVDRTIPALLARFPDAEAVGINWRIFGDSGHAGAGPGLVMERFRRRAPDEYKKNRHLKTITRTDALQKLSPHCSRTLSGKIVDADGLPIAPETPLHSRVATQFAQINHYFGKSREEWALKRQRGKADHPSGSSARIRPDAQFDEHNRNDICDERILRFLAQTQAERTRLEELIALDAGDRAAAEPWSKARSLWRRTLSLKPGLPGP